ncbi:MAG: TIGR04283 family arsenosugar biosynthesis glycosyltransferase [Cyclobacteriaceae bacterium]
MKISIIIPTYNEEEHLAKLLDTIRQNAKPDTLQEVIVCDGGSQDRTLEIAREAGVRVLESPRKGRSAQMNYAAEQAGGEVLHFIHADCLPPKDFTWWILYKLRPGVQAGCFMSKFDLPHWFLRLGNYFSFLPFWFCRGGGQTLFITADLFQKLGGYDESMVLMEEYDLIARIKEHTRFRVIRRFVITSARDYRVNGPMRLQLTYIRVFKMYSRGATQQEMIDFVKSRVRK